LEFPLAEALVDLGDVKGEPTKHDCRFEVAVGLSCDCSPVQ